MRPARFIASSLIHAARRPTTDAFQTPPFELAWMETMLWPRRADQDAAHQETDVISQGFLTGDAQWP
jgi:hypothetical protein